MPLKPDESPKLGLKTFTEGNFDASLGKVL